LGRKLAKYVVAVENDMPGAKLEVTDEDLRRAKQGRGKSKPVKPASAGKSQQAEVNKKLEENEMEGWKEAETSSCQSESVKVGKSDAVTIQVARCQKGNRIDLPPDVTENRTVLI
jgi:hypothetical protein